MGSIAPSARKQGFFRWNMIVPAVVATAAGAVVAVFFLDGLVERGLERAATKANGAVVELEDVDIDLIGMSLTLRGLQVTDRKAPMTNAIEVESMSFDLAGKPLAWKKIIIESGEIRGIRTGTPRKRSGALPASALADGEGGDAGDLGLMAGAKDAGKKAAGFAAGNLKQQYDPDKMIQAEDLASYRKVQEEKARMGALAKAWESRVEEFDADSKVREVKAWLEDVKKRKFSGAAGITEAKKTLDEAKKHRADLGALKKAAEDMKNSLSAEVAGAGRSIRSIDELKAQDLNAAVGRLKGGAFSTEGLSRGIIGPEWFGKLETWLGMFHRVRAMIPKSAGKKEKKPPPSPREGRNIEFPFRYRWPVFHLKKAELDGATSGDKPLDYTGTLRDVTSDPRLVGRPIRLGVKGEKRGDPRKLKLDATLDYTGETARENVDLRYSGMDLAGTKLGNAGGDVSIGSGSGSVVADIGVRGNGISGEVKFTANPVKIDHRLSEAEAKKRVNVILADVLRKMTRMDVTVFVSDTITSPNLRIRTSIDQALNRAVKEVLAKELAEVKAKVKGRIDGLVDAEKNKLAGIVGDSSKKALGGLAGKTGALGSLDKEVENATTGLAKQAVPGVKIPKFKL